MFSLALNLSHAAEADTTKNPPAIVNQDLSGIWLFAYTRESSRVPDGRLFAAAMPVPGEWDDTIDKIKAASLWPDATFNPRYKPIKFPYFGKPPDTSLPFLIGTGWYRKSLDAPLSWKGRMVTLTVGQAVMDTTVYLNGREIQTHIGNSASWEIDLSSHLNYGASNDLVISVNNTHGRSSTRLRGYAGTCGGIFAPVGLRVSGGASRVSSLYVHPESGKLFWNVAVAGRVSSHAELRWEVRDAGRAMLNGTSSVTASNVVWQTPATGLLAWSDRNPKLYEIAVKLVDEGRLIDETRQSFGLRRLVSDGTVLKLNGDPIYLRGHTEHFYFPETCTPPFDKETYVKRLTQLKKLGFNFLRFHTWFPTEPYMQAADETGFLIQIEGFSNVQMHEWDDMLLAGRTHPCIAIYCFGNEEMLDEPKILEAAEFAREQKKLAPDGLFSPNDGDRGIVRSSKEDGNNSGFGSPVVEKPFPHNPKRLAAVTEFSDVLEPHILGDLSYHSIKGDWREIEQRMSVFQRPCLVHEAGIIGSYLDLKLADRYKNTRIGPDLYTAARDYLKQREVLDRAPLFYSNSVAWQRLIRKDMLETARKIHGLVGYDLLGAVDMHWHRTGYEVGIMNEFFEMKPGQTVADVLCYNGESVLLMDDQRQRILGSGQEHQLDLKVSWYGRQPVSHGQLHWLLKGARGRRIDGGERGVGIIPPGSIDSLGTVTISAPKVQQPQKVNLTVQLTDDSGTIANNWDFWVFPPAPPIMKNPGLIVTRELDQNVLEKLTNGASVVLLGNGPLPARAMTFQQGVGGRTEANLATVIGKHPVADAFPHDGYFDWQFYRMTAGATAVIFDSLPVKFDPIIEVASSYKNVVIQSALFEWQVGKGRLIVCTLNLDDKFPEAAYLKALILNYAAGSHFVPAPEIAGKDLAGLIARPRGKVRKLDNDDEGLDPRAREIKTQSEKK